MNNGYLCVCVRCDIPLCSLLVRDHTLQNSRWQIYLLERKMGWTCHLPSGALSMQTVCRCFIRNQMTSPSPASFLVQITLEDEFYVTIHIYMLQLEQKRRPGRGKVVQNMCVTDRVIEIITSSGGFKTIKKVNSLDVIG